MKKPYLFFVLVLLSFSKISSAQTLSTTLPSTNGIVNAIVSSGSTIYVGGSFTYVGKLYGNAIVASTTTGTVNTSFPVISGSGTEVKQIIGDGSGGFYLVGNFTMVGSTARNNIARINSDGTLNSWNPGANCNSPINAIALSSDNNTVFVGGSFTTIGVTSSSRNRIAAISASTGEATTWNPGISGGQVTSLALSASSTIYVGGTFTTSNTVGANTLTRNRIVEINTGDNNATTWNPNANSEVSAILVSGSNVYTGGSFTSIGGSTRNYIARIPNSGSTVDSWNPNSDNAVTCLTISGSTVYAGGTFTSIGGATTKNLAALDANTNTNNASATWLATSTITSGSTSIYSLSISSNTLFVGGNFATIGGSTRTNFAAIDVTSLAAFTVATLDCSTSGQVNTSCVSGSNIYIGGSFKLSAGSPRRSLVSINGTTGAINSWNPNPNESVADLLLSSNGADAFVSGAFTTIGGQSRNRLAKLSTSTGLADATWDPNANSSVEKMALNSTGTTLFFYGAFSTINGATARQNAAAVSTTGTGVATAFSFTGLNDIVTRLITVAPGDSIIYFGYNSTSTINGATRNYFCALRTSNGTSTNWNPAFNQAPFSVAYTGTTMYLGGQFTSIGGDASYQRIAKFSGAAGWHEPVQDVNWNNSSSTRPNGDVRVVLHTSSGTDPLLYLCGSFSAIGATSRQSYAAVKASDLTVKTWNLAVDNNGTLNNRMHVSNSTSKIYIGDNANQLVLNANFSNFGAVTGDASDPLPIKLLSFEGKFSLQNKTVALKWCTASEIENDHFELERLTNQNEGFQKISDIKGNGNSASLQTYYYNDAELKNEQTIYYRLKQVDKNGSFEYSNVIAITSNLNDQTFQVFPNPNNGVFTIQCNEKTKENSELKIINSLGQVVYQSIMEPLKSSFSIDIKTLPIGWYTIQLNTNNKSSSQMLYFFEK